jgi:hypothetical protein
MDQDIPTSPLICGKMRLNIEKKGLSKTKKPKSVHLATPIITKAHHHTIYGDSHIKYDAVQV